MIDTAKFKPKTTYTIYIASTPDKVWRALTDPAFTRQYFFGRAIEIAPNVGGAFVLRMEDGKVDTRGEVVEWSPPHRLAVTWRVEWVPEMRELPESLLTYDIEQAGGSVRLTMKESHRWDPPDTLLEGGRSGWPAILSGLKSVLETGKPLAMKVEPPKAMMAALSGIVAAKPWLK